MKKAAHAASQVREVELLSKDIRVIDIDPDQLERAVETFRKTPRPGKKTLIIFYQGNKAIHAVHSRKGPVAITGFRGPRNLKHFLKEHGVDRVVCLERGALHRFTAAAQTRIRTNQTLLEQILAGKEPLEREWGSGISVYPDPLTSMPRLPDTAFRLLRALLPRRLMAIISVFDHDGGIMASAIIEMKNGEITLLTTTDTLQPFTLEGGDMNRKADKLIGALAKTHGRPTVGIFTDRAGFEHVAAHPKPLSALAHLVKLKWALIRPFPYRLRVLLALAPILKL